MKYLWLALVAWLAVGCMPASSTASGPAFVHPNFPYAVTYDDDENKSVMGEEWRLETYRRKDKATASSPTELERKADFEAAYEFDFNDDDKTDAKAKLPIPDLLFVNKRTSARLELVTILLDNHTAAKELRVLLNDIVDSGSGTRSLFVGFGRTAAGIEKRYASRLLDSQEAFLGGQKGLVATIEQVDLDKREIDPKTRGRKSRLFLLRAPFAYYATETSVVSTPGSPSSSSATSSTSSGASGSTASLKSDYHRYSVLMLVEYSNSPDDYEAQYPEFLRLLNKIHPLSDERLLGYLALQASRCASAGTKSSELSIEVSPVGASSARASAGFDVMCLSDAISNYKFAATGETRVVSGSFDFSKPIPAPEWFTHGEYNEELPAPASEAPPAPPASDAPAAAPAPAAPAEGTPAAPPAAQPGG